VDGRSLGRAGDPQGGYRVPGVGTGQPRASRGSPGWAEVPWGGHGGLQGELVFSRVGGGSLGQTGGPRASGYRVPGVARGSPGWVRGPWGGQGAT